MSSTNGSTIAAKASHEPFPTRAEQFPFHSGQVPVKSLDPRGLLLDPGHEFVNDFCLSPDGGMTRGQVVGQFHRDGGHRDTSLRA
jgi:hypothetical protein